MSYGIRNISNGLRRVKLILVLDSNEYILYLHKKSFLIEKILNDQKATIFIDELIVKEVLRNIKEEVKKEFYSFLFKNEIPIFHAQLPISLIQKYKKLGLKKGDIGIAAFCEYIKAEYLITENRHFLKIKADTFRVVTLKEVLALIK